MPPEAQSKSSRRPAASERPGFPWVQLLPLLGLVGSVAASAIYGFPTGLIVVGATLLLVGIWNLWVSLQILAGDRPAESYASSPDAPSNEQEQKAFLLRALEDLEFERSVGKIDDDDYQALRHTFRERAKQALAPQKTEARQRAEQLAHAFVERSRAGAPPADRIEEPGASS